MVECVSLGDYHCAVGFLLATPPDRSPRCCQGALCALALAPAAAAVPGSKQNTSKPAASQSGTDTGAAAALATPSAGNRSRRPPAAYCSRRPRCSKPSVHFQICLCSPKLPEPVIEACMTV